MKEKRKLPKTRSVKSVDLVVSTMESLITTVGCSCCSARWFAKEKKLVVAKMARENYCELEKLVIRFYTKFVESEFSKEPEMHISFSFGYVDDRAQKIVPLWGAEVSRNSVPIGKLVNN